MQIKLKKDEVLVIKRCKGNNISHNNFVYPKKGIVECLDWNDKKECGNGLHGWTVGFENYFENYKGNFVVILVNKKDGYVELEDKVKFRKGKVLINTPNVEEAHALVLSVYPNIKLHWNTTKQGDCSTANQGYYSTANQGHSSTANQGDYSIAKQGDCSTANQGHYSTANQGDYSTANQGYHSTAKQGYYSTAKQGDYSTAKQGHSSTANQGYYSTAKQGDYSTAKQGHSSTAKQGHFSTANQGHSSTANQGHCSTANQGHYSTAKQGDCSTATVFGKDFIYKNSSKLCVVVMFNEDKMYIFRGDKDFKPNETIKIVDNEIKFRYTNTPEKITKLKEHEIFVFGSNLNGNHMGGAAKLAQDKFGAKDGIGEGLEGSSYAFPTIGKDMKLLSDEELKSSAEKLIKCACKNTTKIFFLTKVGYKIAGQSEEKMKEFFKETPANIIKPVNW